MDGCICSSERAAVGHMHPYDHGPRRILLTRSHPTSQHAPIAVSNASASFRPRPNDRQNLSRLDSTGVSLHRRRQGPFVNPRPSHAIDTVCITRATPTPAQSRRRSLSAIAAEATLLLCWSLSGRQMPHRSPAQTWQIHAGIYIRIHTHKHIHSQTHIRT